MLDRRTLLVAALGFAVLCLLASATPADAEESWEPERAERAAACSQNAWTLTGLGAVGIVVILALGGATISRNELYYRNPWWRLAWWASCLSLLAGLTLFKVYCRELMLFN